MHIRKRVSRGIAGYEVQMVAVTDECGRDTGQTAFYRKPAITNDGRRRSRAREFIRRWRTVLQIYLEMKPGRTLVSVPEWMYPEVCAHIWAKNVEHATEKWANLESEVSLQDWQAAMRKKGGRADA